MYYLMIFYRRSVVLCCHGAFLPDNPLIYKHIFLPALNEDNRTHVFETHNDDSDQNGRMTRLISVFAGQTYHFFLVLSCFLFFVDLQIFFNSISSAMR